MAEGLCPPRTCSPGLSEQFQQQPDDATAMLLGCTSQRHGNFKIMALGSRIVKVDVQVGGRVPVLARRQGLAPCPIATAECNSLSGVFGLRAFKVLREYAGVTSGLTAVSRPANAGVNVVT